MSTRLRAVSIGLVLSMIAVLGVSSAAADDFGDGNEACNNGEICLADQRKPQWERSVKHFWWSSGVYVKSSDGQPYLWWDVVSNIYLSEHVYDNVSSVRNKDSSCLVRFFTLPWHNYNGIEQTVSNTGLRIDILAQADPDVNPGVDGISGHLRCP